MFFYFFFYKKKRQELLSFFFYHDIKRLKLKALNKGKKRYFTETEDKKVTEFLKTCKSIVFPVAFGRYELEEYLIKKHKPLLNRKDNKD